MRFQTGYYFRKGMVVQQDFEKGRSQRFFRVSRWGRGGGGGLYAVLNGILKVCQFVLMYYCIF